MPAAVRPVGVVACMLAITLSTGCRCGADTETAPPPTPAPSTPAAEASGQGVADEGSGDVAPPGPHVVASLTGTRPPTSIDRCGQDVVVSFADGRVGVLGLGDELTFDAWTSMAPPGRFIGCMGSAVVFVDTGDTRLVVRDIDARRDIGSVSVEGRIVDVALRPHGPHLWSLERSDQGAVAVVRDATSIDLAALSRADLGPTPIGFVDTPSGLYVPDFRGRRVDRLEVAGAVITVDTFDTAVRPTGLVQVGDRVHVRTMNGTEAPGVGATEAADASWPWPVGLALDRGEALWVHGSSTARLARLDPATLAVVAELDGIADAIELVDRGPDLVVVRAGAEPGLTRIDTTTNTVVDRVPLSSRPSGAMAVGGQVVVLLPDENRVDLWDFASAD